MPLYLYELHFHRLNLFDCFYSKCPGQEQNNQILASLERANLKPVIVNGFDASTYTE